MTANQDSPPRSQASLTGPEYPGRILTGSFSRGLKRRVAECIRGYDEMDRVGSGILTYISAWHQSERIIWYEFVSQPFRELLACSAGRMVDDWRSAVVDQRNYRFLADDGRVEKAVLNRSELSGTRQELRRQVETSGRLEAVYKITLPDGGSAWLKDRAQVEIHPLDEICLSLGSLIPVTKEMALEERCERLIDRLQRAAEQIRRLSGMLPICSGCKKIRDDRGYWSEVEAYIARHSEATFSHGICPECARRLYPELYEEGGPQDRELERLGDEIADIDTFLKNL